MVIGKRLFVVDVHLCIGCQCCIFACSGGFGEAGTAKSAIRVRSGGGLERGFVVIVCGVCKDPPWMKMCHTDTSERRTRDGGVVPVAGTVCFDVSELAN